MIIAVEFNHLIIIFFLSGLKTVDVKFFLPLNDMIFIYLFLAHAFSCTYPHFA